MDLHIDLMSLGVTVANEYECNICRARWSCHDNGYVIEWCVSLSSVERRLYFRYTEGVLDAVESRECSRIDAKQVNTVRVRKILSINGGSQGKVVSILANSLGVFR